MKKVSHRCGTEPNEVRRGSLPRPPAEPVSQNSRGQSVVAAEKLWNDVGVRPALLLLTSRRHIDLLRVAAATC
jgi:hypothetical protein